MTACPRRGASHRCGLAGPLLLGLASLQLLTSQAAQAEPPLLQQPVKVRLHWKAEATNPNIRKLGIYAALNGGTPASFEFDTGGSGFFATYASTPPPHSHWWGASTPDCSSPGLCIPFTPITYDSGLTYSGNQLTASVQLFDGSSDTTPRISSAGLNVGQTTSIVCTSTTPPPTCANASSASGWPAPYPPAPVEGRFFGDFGMSVKQSSNASLNSVVMQSAFWNQFDTSVVTPGYRVHASQDNPWVQFGLGAEDLKPRPRTFALNSSTGGTASSLTGGINNGTLRVENGNDVFTGQGLTSLIFDTGATTTIHSGTVTLTGADFTSQGSFPCSLLAIGCPLPPGDGSSTVLSGARVLVRGPSLTLGGAEVDILELIAGTDKDTDPDFNAVAVQGLSSGDLAPACSDLNTACYFLNTGILPFLENDVIVNLDPALAGNYQLTLVSHQPEGAPGPIPVLGLSSALAMARRLRGKRGKRRLD